MLTRTMRYFNIWIDFLHAALTRKKIKKALLCAFDIIEVKVILFFVKEKGSTVNPKEP